MLCGPTSAGKVIVAEIHSRVLLFAGMLFRTLHALDQFLYHHALKHRRILRFLEGTFFRGGAVQKEGPEVFHPTSGRQHLPGNLIVSPAVPAPEKRKLRFVPQPAASRCAT